MAWIAVKKKKTHELLFGTEIRSEFRLEFLKNSTAVILHFQKNSDRRKGVSWRTTKKVHAFCGHYSRKPLAKAAGFAYWTKQWILLMIIMLVIIIRRIIKWIWIQIQPNTSEARVLNLQSKYSKYLPSYICEIPWLLRIPKSRIQMWLKQLLKS